MAPAADVESPLSTAAMRIAATLLAALTLAGCDLTAPAPIEAAVLTSVVVEKAPLDAVWDRDVFGPNGPEIYVAIRSVDLAPDVTEGQRVRTDDAQDVIRAQLPLTLAARPAFLSDRVASFGVDERVVVDVLDDDTFNGDEVLFRSDTLRFGDVPHRADAVGDERTLTLGDHETQIRLRFRWE